MTEAIKPEEMLKELRAIRKDLDFIKTHIVDGDIVLTKDDLQSIEDAEMDHRHGKTKRLV